MQHQWEEYQNFRKKVKTTSFRKKLLNQLPSREVEFSLVNISSCLIIISLQKSSPCLTHFLPMFHFYNPWKNKKSEGFIDVFRDYRSGRVVENGFMILCTLLLLYSLNTFSSFCLFCLLLLNKVVRVHTWVSFWSKFSVLWKWLKNFTCVSRISLNLSYFQKFLNLTRETLTLLMKVWTNGFSIDRAVQTSKYEYWRICLHQFMNMLYPYSNQRWSSCNKATWPFLYQPKKKL